MNDLQNDNIILFYKNVDKEKRKLEHLCHFLEFEPLSARQSVIFVNTRSKVDWLTDKMRSHDHKVSVIRGGMDHNTRDIIMRDFCSGASRMLITNVNDLLTRCTIVPQVQFVINYDLPTRRKSYYHRIECGGIFVSRAAVLNFVTRDNYKWLVEIRRFYEVRELPSSPCSFAELLNQIKDFLFTKELRSPSTKSEIKLKHFFIRVGKEKWKLKTVCDMYKHLSATQSVIFVNTGHTVDWLTNKMRSCNHAVSATHEEFRLGSSRMLITTDLLARGIDVQEVSIVINYDLPTQPENYFYRVGSSGTFKRRAVVLSFFTEDDYRLLDEIQSFINGEIVELP